MYKFILFICLISLSHYVEGQNVSTKEGWIDVPPTLPAGGNDPASSSPGPRPVYGSG